MRLFSFRSKLILAMSLVVTGVTVAVLFATQQSVKEAYLKLFDEQFHSQIRYFLDARLKILEAVEEKCATIARSPQVVAAMEAGDSTRAYEILIDELRDFNKAPEKENSPTASGSGTKAGKNSERTGGSARKRSSGGLDPKSPSFPFVRLADAKGTPIELPDPTGQIKKALGKNKRQEQLLKFARNAPPEVLQQQEIGYCAIDLENRPVPLHQFVVTPIFGEKHNTALGALMLGIPVRDFGELTMFAFSEKSLCSGIWVAGKIYSETIPESARENVAAHVAEDLKDKRASTTSSQVELDGVPYLLYTTIINPDSAFDPAAEVCLFALSEYTAAKNHLRNLVLEVGGAALLLGVVLILLISDGFSKPVEELSKATLRIGHGDFEARVPVRSRDELGTLASSFNAMAEGLALKEKYKSVLAQVADPQIAEELMSGKVTLGGECRQVSMLFCDIRGFTARTEGMRPEDVIAMLNEHMTALNRMVHEHCGVVDKFVGDMIMAIFGAPKSYGDDAAMAARCALAMLEERRQLNLTSHHHLEIGIGLATGEVVAGCMGSADRLNYTVLGERVNLAARLCSQAGGMEILMDEATRAHLPDDARFTSIQPLRLKGFSDMVTAYKLEAIGPAFAPAEAKGTPPSSEDSSEGVDQIAAV